MNEKEFNDFIHFSDQKEYIKNQLEKEEWTTVYKFEKQEKNGYTNGIHFYSYLVSEERKNKDRHKESGWIMPKFFVKPGIVEHSKDLSFINRIKRFISFRFFREFYMNDLFWGTLPYEKEKLNKERRQKNPKEFITKYEVRRFLFRKIKNLLRYESKKIKKYQRFSEEGIEPLVHLRNFEYSNHPSYIEISEEFRHYFDLYEDQNKRVFLSADESGNPVGVIKIIDNDETREVKIKKKYLNEFLFVKKMWLCVQFYCWRHFKENLKKSINEEFQSEDKNFIYSLNSGNGNTIEKSWTRLRGRKFIKYKDVKSFWHEREKKYEKFSFIDENGEEKTFTCEEDKIAPILHDEETGIPGYMTLISFRKDVLKKYYDKPNQYSVSDGYLKCDSFWFMRIDIQDDRVVVYLGDLSKIPYEEQKYWRSYNIIEAAGISQEAWERDIEGKFTETDRPDFFFKNRYQKFNQIWQEKYGWSFFKPLSEKDKHCIDSLRIPLNEEQLEFDTQIQYLTKVFIDSINTKEIRKTFPTSYKEDSKTIDILDQCLKARNIKASPMIEFLKGLQKLRSKGSAHTATDKEYTKTLNYFKQLKGINKPDSKSEIFSQILIICIWTMNSLEKLFLNERNNSVVENKVIDNQSGSTEVIK